jgi:mono/diheme cytochrome c family protein
MMQKAIESDLNAAASHAAEVKSAFEKVEQFWAKHNVDDAQEFASNIQEAADAVQQAAKAGNKEEAMAAAKQIGANCQGCHQAHREKGADGKFVIK